MIITGLLLKALRGVAAAVTNRYALFQLSRLSPHLLRDMGFDPDDIAAVRNGELRPAEPFRRRLQRRAKADADLRARLSPPARERPEEARPNPQADPVCLQTLAPAQDICC